MPCHGVQGVNHKSKALTWSSGKSSGVGTGFMGHGEGLGFRAFTVMQGRRGFNISSDNFVFAVQNSHNTHDAFPPRLGCISLYTLYALEFLNTKP